MNSASRWTRRRWAHRSRRWASTRSPPARLTTPTTNWRRRISKTASPLETFRAGLPACGEIELWWQDDETHAFHRVGQKNTITRRWARRGTRPLASRDQRTKSVSLFGAICPAKGKGSRSRVRNRRSVPRTSVIVRPDWGLRRSRDPLTGGPNPDRDSPSTRNRQQPAQLGIE